MALKEEFEAHAEKAESLSLSESTILYGLFKQATLGDVTTNAGHPGVLNMRDMAKWDAWKAVEGKSKDEAMSDYITKVKQLLEVAAGADSSAPALDSDSDSPFRVACQSWRRRVNVIYSSSSSSSPQPQPQVVETDSDSPFRVPRRFPRRPVNQVSDSSSDHVAVAVAEEETDSDTPFRVSRRLPRRQVNCVSDSSSDHVAVAEEDGVVDAVAKEDGIVDAVAEEDGVVDAVADAAEEFVKLFKERGELTRILDEIDHKIGTLHSKLLKKRSVITVVDASALEILTNAGIKAVKGHVD